MSFKLLIFPPNNRSSESLEKEWPDKIRARVPGVEIMMAESTGEAMEMIGEADAAYGDIVPELLERGKNLKWIACPQAGPHSGYYHEGLVNSDVVVTNTREIYNDHISAHIMSYILAFARGLHVYIPRQLQRNWQPGYDTFHLPDSTVAVIGIGGIGRETARLCAEFGMTVLAIDARVTEAPKGVSELYGPDALLDVLSRADFVVVTVPETPETQGMFNASVFGVMKSNAIFINIGRGATVILDDLAGALESGQIGGAALDVFQIEPLPADHALWGMPNVIITPHTAGIGPYLEDRRAELFVENCVRFAEGQELMNVVDKANWF